MEEKTAHSPLPWTDNGYVFDDHAKMCREILDRDGNIVMGRDKTLDRFDVKLILESVNNSAAKSWHRQRKFLESQCCIFSLETPLIIEVIFDDLEPYISPYERDYSKPSISWNCPHPDSTAHFGEPLYRPSGRPISRWAIDGYITTNDSRYIVFGPYLSANEALEAVERIKKAADIYGVLETRIQPEQGFEPIWDCCAGYTDG